jgi:2-polyprenyl-3-methyl-5-hydroxy-6-metoxy-1,4-benzoquinol methylase
MVIIETFIEEADVHTASHEYAERFSGKVGQWMLSIQTQIVLQAIEEQYTSELKKNIQILDIGGGHGQLALPLLEAGYTVTVLCSNTNAYEQLKKPLFQKYRDENRLIIVIGNLFKSPFEVRSFDIVLSFRLLCHTEQWKNLLSEMNRVSRQTILFDYPNKKSINFFSGMFFKAKKNIEKNTRSFILFEHGEIIHMLQNYSINEYTLYNQFFFPMVLHRILGKRGFLGVVFSKSIEKAAKLIGLSGAFGSPTICSAKINQRDLKSS